MLKEEYCSFKQAKALKELGFPNNISYSYYYHPISEDIIDNVDCWCYDPDDWDDYIPMPTVSEGLKWLKDEFHDIYGQDLTGAIKKCQLLKENI